MTTRRFALSGLLLIAAVLPLCRANEIGYIEAFSLADDRAVPLKQLMPGTEEYYYYHCLHAQNTGALGRADELLKAWIDKHGYTARVEEIRNRQALLIYPTNPQAAIDHIRQRLNLRFDHQKQVMDEKPSFPTELDQRLISRETLTQQAMSEFSNLDGFENSALEFLVKARLDPDRRRNLLHRLERPDYPKLAEMVVADLRSPPSGGFGSHPIHAQLLLTQMEECAKLMPELLNNGNFVNAWLPKLLPGADVDWPRDPAEKQAYLERLWAFVSRLPPAFNSLKTSALFHRLSLDRSQGVYDKDRFMTYLKLPRVVHYINPKYLERRENAGSQADLNANFEGQTALPPIGMDEPLVRDFLAHFLVEAKDYEEFAPYIETNYLKWLFAETKIVNSVGNLEQWYTLLPGDRIQALKDRIDVELLPTNKEVIAPADPVTLDVALKNVATLIVKVYEINTLNYYRERQAEISTDVDLDGLVANDEKVVNYTQTPLQRHVEKFEFPNLTKPGVYVIELIGNGRSSRALIRKGRLTFTERIGAAGHVFTVYDSDNKRLTDATLWLSGKEYTPDKSGEITVPFAAAPATVPIVLCHNGFAALDNFAHMPEEYGLRAGIFVDRESLLAGRNAQVLVRPMLAVNGYPVDIGLLEEPTLVIDTMDREGISTHKEVKDFKLYDDRESTYEFRVPDKLEEITFRLKGRVQNLSRNAKEPVECGRPFMLNWIDRTETIADLHLRHADNQYTLELRGKSGEAMPDRPLALEFKHRDFRRPVNVTLQTDAEGRVRLGTLADIDTVQGTGPEGTQKSWNLNQTKARCVPATAVHALTGSPVSIPIMHAMPPDKSEAFSFLELRGPDSGRGTFVADCRNQVSFRDGFLVLDDLRAGNYDLRLKDTGTSIAVRITQGRQDGNYLLSRDRFLEVRNPQPLQITAVAKDAGGKALRVTLKNATDAARVHVAAGRFLPAHPIFDHLGSPDISAPVLCQYPRPISNYMSGRNIGDEYRYVLERKYAGKFPGNMLQRPSLLLNPWNIRKTETGTQEAQGGEAWRPASAPAPSRARASGRPAEQEVGIKAAKMAGDSAFVSNLDFLATPSVVLANLKPDKDGVVTVDLAKFGPCQQVHVLAVDAQNTVYREVSLPAVPEKPLDLRMRPTLDPQKHYTEQKNVTAVLAGRDFTLNDVTTAKMEVYDSLARVYTLFATLSHDANLTEFGFILDWPNLPKEKRQELYSKYACHELSFFLFKKDPEFFRTAILPHLTNKKDRTFLDQWLVGADLAAYVRPWAYQRLNIVERILLAQRRRDAGPATTREVRELWELVTPDLDRLSLLFKTAIMGSALEVGGGFGGALADAEPTATAEGVATVPTAAAPALAFADAMEKGAANGKPMQPLRAAAKVAPFAERTEAAAKAKTEEDMFAGFGAGKELKRDAARQRADKQADLERRKAQRQLYRKLDKTEEWVENNYYRLPIEQQLADLVTVNAFWRDYAAYNGDGPFLSTNVAEASRNFTEMMYALAVLDLPFKAAEHKTDRAEAKLTLKPGSPVIVYHKELREAQPDAKAQTLLVSQNFFALDDRYRHEGNEQYDKFVTEEFQTHRVYGCQVVLTNPTSARRKVEALLQIPQGAIPVSNGAYSQSENVALDPYSTQTQEYFFYFPAPGKFGHLPVHVAEKDRLIAFTPPFTFTVVNKLTQIDTTCWAYVSQYASDQDVFNFLDKNNIGRCDLDLIAFRMRDKQFFRKALDLLQARFVYHNTLWSYGLYHNDTAAAREYLPHSPYADQCGLYVDTPLLTIDPVLRYTYQHKEYWPLVSPRVYQLGQKRRILNTAFFQQYTQFLTYLAYRPKLTPDDLLTVTDYLLLQDRIEEAMRFFEKVDQKGLATAMQYDYAKAYLAFYRGEVKDAADIAREYRESPVDHWRKRFQDLLAQADEIRGEGAQVVDKEDRTQIQTQLAATEPSFDFKVEDRKIEIQYQNIENCVINYYLMDVELLFSRNPFVQEVSGQFSVIRPNDTATVELAKGAPSKTLDLPERYHARNVMVEIVAAGVRKTQAYYPHSLGIQITENYGQLRITQDKSRKPLAKVYVKVYARMKDGQVKFYKDGYTDLRGRFDYTSLNTNELEMVDRFSILILSEANGAAVREAAPPKV